MNIVKRPLRYFMGISLSLLSTTTLSTSLYSNKSCHLLESEQARSACYNETQRAIPLAKSKLPEGQELVDSYRCGNKLLHPDMTLNEVSKLCPPSQHPDEIDRYLQSFEVHHQGYYGFHYISLQTYEMEKWTFKQYGRFRTYVVFRDGVIYQIIQDRSVRN